MVGINWCSVCDGIDYGIWLFNDSLCTEEEQQMKNHLFVLVQLNLKPLLKKERFPFLD